MNGIRSLHRKTMYMKFLILCLLLFPAACSAGPGTAVTETAGYTATPYPTNSRGSTPARTPSPSATDQPSPTPTATPMPLLGTLSGRVIRNEPFDTLSMSTFSTFGTIKPGVAAGNLVLSDMIPSDGDPWKDTVAVRSTFSPKVGNTSVILFEAEANACFGFHYELYENTQAGEGYMGINLDGNNAELSLNIDKGVGGGNHFTQRSIPILYFRPGRWYLYSLLVEPGGIYNARIWERDRPDRPIFNSSFTLDPEWAKPGFTFVLTVWQGKIEVDEYQEVEPLSPASTP